MKSLVFLLLLAACSNYSAEILTIVTGVTKLSEGGDTYQVSKAIYHEGWGALRVHDIGLLMTDRDIQFGDKVKVMQLGTQEIPVGRKLLVSGWGHTSHPGETSDHLKFIELRAISLITCATAVKPTLVFNTQFCTYNRPGEGTCDADSGGPVVFMNRVVGIVSFGKKCAVGKPDVFTKVSAYIQWINETIRENERDTTI
ncbi:uncharacterized protein CBL_03174 [Carabus blaptoides fortunei]